MTAVLAMTAGCGAASTASAATLPYFEDFEDEIAGNTTPSEPAPESGVFVEGADADFQVVQRTGNKVYNDALTPDTTQSASLINFSGALGGAAGTAQDFTLSTTFNTANVGNSTVGLAFLWPAAGTTGYYVDVSMSSAVIRLVEVGAASPTTDLGTIAAGSTYTLTVSGDYIDTNADNVNDALSVSASLSGPGVTSDVTTFPTDTTVQTGTFFGYRNRTNASDLNVDLDDFGVVAGVTVPEPAFGGIALATAAVFAGRRRRTPFGAA